MRRHPELGHGVRRTLERRVREWRALHGPERNSFFARPIRRASSACRTLPTAATCGSASPASFWNTFCITSGWRIPASPMRMWYSAARVSPPWPKVSNMPCGPSAALRRNTAATVYRPAYRNLDVDQREDATQRYAALCAHYDMAPTRNNRGESHENGSIEGPHGHLKRALEDALLLRGSRDFDTLADYRALVDEVVSRRNSHLRARIDVERAVLRPLPPRRTDDFDTVRVRVTSSGGFTYRRVFYSVPSRLIRVYYGTLAGLIESLTEAKAAANLSRRLHVLTHPALLVVDEIGYLPVNQDGAVLFFQLINARHERASTVLTSNKGFEEWGGVLGDEVMAAALIGPPAPPLPHRQHPGQQLPDEGSSEPAAVPARIGAAKEPRRDCRPHQKRCGPPRYG